VSNENSAPRAGRNQRVNTLPVNGQQATAIANPPAIANPLRAGRPNAQLAGDYVESSETEDDRPKEPRKVGGKKQRAKTKKPSKENTGSQLAAPETEGMATSREKRKPGRPKKNQAGAQPLPLNTDAI
jgi:hypothetical protein